MAIKIDKPIVKVSVAGQEESTIQASPTQMKRPCELCGTTYKIKDNYRGITLYATVNNHEGAPVELFANSKHSECDQWVHLSTLLISHILQSSKPLSPQDVVALMKEVRSEYPYPSKELGRQVNSMVQELGFILERHINNLNKPKRGRPKKRVVAKKKAAPKKRAAKKRAAAKKEVKGQECPKCHEMTLFLMDGCMTCTSCGESKCG